MRVIEHLATTFGTCKLMDLTADDIELYLRRRLRRRVPIRTLGGVAEGSELKPSTVHREQLAFQDWAEFFLEIIQSRHFELWNIMPRAVMLYVRHPTFFQRACHEMPCPPLYR